MFSEIISERLRAADVEDAVRSAIKSQRMFNLMHLDSGIKVDLIVRKNSEYRHVEFDRRKAVDFAGISTWIK